MGFWSAIFGLGPRGKYDLIKTLVKRRLLDDPMAMGRGFDYRSVDTLGQWLLQGLPEGTIVAIAETYAMLKRQSCPEPEIFARIEGHRSRAGAGQMPSPLTLESYTRYRLAIEHRRGAPIADSFIDEAVQVCRMFFNCPSDQAPPTHAERSTPDTTFMASMPHPKVDRAIRRLRFAAESIIIEYYENPRTIGTVEAGIAQTYECPQVAVVIERNAPALIVRTEKSTSGSLMLCALDTAGKHANYGPYEPKLGTSDEFIQKVFAVFRQTRQTR